MGCIFSVNNKIEDISSTSTDSDGNAGGLKQKSQIPQNPIQYANQPPSVQRYINPTRYKRDEEVYINRFVTNISFFISGAFTNFWG